MLNMGAASSLVIVPWAVAFVELMIDTFVGLLKLTVNVSFPSNRTSEVVWTAKVVVVSPGAKVKVAVFAVKSVSLAVSPVAIEVVTVTLCEDELFPVRVTVKIMIFPSVAEAEVIANCGNS